MWSQESCSNSVACSPRRERCAATLLIVSSSGAAGSVASIERAWAAAAARVEGSIHGHAPAYSRQFVERVLAFTLERAVPTSILYTSVLYSCAAHVELYECGAIVRRVGCSKRLTPCR